jgi:hypothetical protein
VQSPLVDQRANLRQPPLGEDHVVAQLVFMASLQKIVNGGGFIDREYAVGSEIDPRRP